MLPKKAWRNADFIYIGVIIVLLVFSLLVLSSASANLIKSDPYFFTKKQFLWMIVGLIAAVAVLSVDYTFLARYTKVLYGLNLVMLLAVLIIGKTAKGAQGWIMIGSHFQFQPSEFSKILVAITLAQFIAARQGKLNRLRDLVPCFIHVGIPMLLILAQPDLGTSLVFLAILFGMLFIGGARPLILVGLIVVGLGAAVGAVVVHINYGMPLPLKDYQLDRLLVFINPYLPEYRHGAGWNIIQSLVAIGSGGLFGKGLYQGPQVQGNFLPEHHTDFIFSVVGEEMGFVGSVLLLGLFFMFIYRGITIATRSRDMFGTLIATGINSMIAFHILENVGMAIGMMPITGIPLPFVSYGGSFMLANMIAVGLMLSINIRRQKIIF